MRAAPPATTAAACEVREPLNIVAPRRAVGRKLSIVDPGARSATIETPGASRSGLPTPSAVGPRLEKGAIVSSSSRAVPFVSTAPTVMTYGSSAGLAIVPSPGPWLPAETTTVRPACHARSTARSSGSTP